MTETNTIATAAPTFTIEEFIAAVRAIPDHDTRESHRAVFLYPAECPRWQEYYRNAGYSVIVLDPIPLAKEVP